MTTSDLDLLSRLRRYEQPPAGFSPRRAAPDELNRYGYPRQPDPEREPRLHALWDTTIDDSYRMITPEFSIDPILSERRSRPLALIDPDRRDAQGKLLSADGWAGAVVGRGDGPALNTVSASFHVPRIFVPPGGLPNGRYSIGVWIGLNGYIVDQQVVQAGIVGWLGIGPGYDGFVRYYAFFEWYPNPPVRIDNFVVADFDEIALTVCTPNPSRGFVAISNKTNPQNTSVGFDPPPGIVSSGSSAEWIVEAPQHLVPRFNDVKFVGCVGGSQSTEIDLGTNPHYVTEISSGTGTVLTQSTIDYEIFAVGPHGVRSNTDIRFRGSGWPA
ncbi:A4/G1 family peptidase [Nocardia colli]|uniref:A4/G1 family peptidase n=1 Tax=Nocardia colli TaxID=2545717 RepID=UPI0035E3230A